jgi:hypothetical protein
MTGKSTKNELQNLSDMKSTEAQPNSHSPLQSLEEWEDFLKDRYPEPGKPAKEFQATDPTRKRKSSAITRPMPDRRCASSTGRIIAPDVRVCPGKAKRVPHLEPTQDEYLGGDGISKHARG